MELQEKSSSQFLTKKAGIWRRIIAFVIDSVFLWCFFILVSTVLYVLFGILLTGKIANLIIGLLYMLYFAGMESSSGMSTLGKRVMRLKVTDFNGKRISFRAGLFRYLSKVLSIIPLGLGYVLALFTRRRQALHDLFAGTYVVLDNGTHIFRSKKAIINVMLIAVLLISSTRPALASSGSEGFNPGDMAMQALHDAVVHAAPHVIPEMYKYTFAEPAQEVYDNYSNYSALEATPKSVITVGNKILELPQPQVVILKVSASVYYKTQCDIKGLPEDEAEKKIEKMHTYIEAMDVVSTFKKEPSGSFVERLKDVVITPYNINEDMTRADDDNDAGLPQVNSPQSDIPVSNSPSSEPGSEDGVNPDEEEESATSAALTVMRGDLQNTGVFASEKISKTPEVLWQFKSDYPVTRRFRNMFILNGTIYFEDDGGIIYGIDLQTGSVKLKKDNQYLTGIAGIDDEQIIGVLGSIYSVNISTWEIKWELQTDTIDLNAMISSSILNDGILYVASDMDVLCAIDADTGEILWKAEGQYDISQPIYDSGKIIVECDDGKDNEAYVKALDAKTGNEIWTYVCPEKFYSARPIVKDGMVYIYDYTYPTWHQETLIALDEASGQVKWKLEKKDYDNYIDSVIVNNDKVYLLGNAGHDLVVMDAKSGNIINSLKIEEQEYYRDTNNDFSNAVISGNTLYILSRYNEKQDISAYDTKNFKLIWKMPFNISDNSEILICDGKIIFINDDTVYAIG